MNSSDEERARTEARNAAMNARYARFLRRNPPEAARQEELLCDLREHVRLGISEAVESLPLSAFFEDEFEAAHSRIRDRQVRRAFDQYRPAHKYAKDCQLEIREFATALWDEGLPSLQQITRALMRERASELCEQSATEETRSHAAEGHTEECPPTDSPEGGNGAAAPSAKLPVPVFPGSDGAVSLLAGSRQALLGEYKAATGDPPNKRIYEAKNSGIHKPEFYEWLRGELQSESETTRNFERFLRAKKPPVPRNPQN